MKLTEKPEVVTWPETHYVFIEKIGPFENYVTDPRTTPEPELITQILVPTV
jgi:hypothetical protein